MKKKVIIACAVLVLASLVYVLVANKSEKDCEGLYCEFLSQIETDFELTGGEKDQGYLFLRDHSELDTTTNRVIIHSIDGVYFAYPSAEGWYAQRKGGEEKITLNELGHSLAEKEIEYEAEIKKMFDQKLKDAIYAIKMNVHYRNYSAKEKGIEVIDTSLFNKLTFETSFFSKELETLRQGDMTFADFTESFNKTDQQIMGRTGVYGERPKIGFYSKSKIFFPVSSSTSIEGIEVPKEKLATLNYEDRVEYLIKNKLVVTTLWEWSTWSDNNYMLFHYACSPLIYVPYEKKWYGSDKLMGIIQKYSLNN
jgi:hypothetical protein